MNVLDSVTSPGAAVSAHPLHTERYVRGGGSICPLTPSDFRGRARLALQPALTSTMENGGAWFNIKNIEHLYGRILGIYTKYLAWPNYVFFFPLVKYEVAKCLFSTRTITLVCITRATYYSLYIIHFWIMGVHSHLQDFLFLQLSNLYSRKNIITKDVWPEDVM